MAVHRAAHCAFSAIAGEKISHRPWFASSSSPFYLPLLPFPACLGFVRRLSAAAPPEMPTVADPKDRSAGFLSLWTNYESRIVHSRTRELIDILQARRWNAALERDLRHSGILLGRRIVDEVVACLPNPKLALQFYVWAGEQIGYPNIASRAACNIFQWHANKPKLVPFLLALKNLRNRHFELSPATVNVLIQGYGWAGMLERAFKVMVRSQSFANDIIVKCFLSSILRERRHDMVYAVYSEIKKHRIGFDLFYNELIQGLALGDYQKWEEADFLFKEASDFGHILDDKTHNNLIWAVSRAGQHERACSLLADALKKKKKIRLESRTVAAVVESLCHAKELQRASRIIEEVKLHGVVVPLEVYNRLLQASTCEPGVQVNEAEHAASLVQTIVSQ